MVEPILALLQDQGSNMIQWVLFIVTLILIQIFGMKIQAWKGLSDIARALDKLWNLNQSASKMFIEEASKYGKSKENVDRMLSRYKGFGIIEPVYLDPAGAVRKLEHLLNTAKGRLDEVVWEIAPKAHMHIHSNLKDMFLSCLALDYIYRVVRHYFIMGKKTQNFYYIFQVQMVLPEIMKIAKAYHNSIDAFRKGTPIGDGLGPLVVARFVSEYDPNLEGEEIAENISLYRITYEGRNVLLVKAKGPGGEVGKPGEAIKRLIEMRSGAISRIIMVDAGGKLEGEPTAEITEYVGAAIGDPGPEKYKIEEVATKYKIPIDSIVVKMDPLDAIAIMKKEISLAADSVVDRIKHILKERTHKGDTIIVAGIGNSIGIR